MFGKHQSTINNNIPIRFLMYAGRIYEQLLDGHRKYEMEQIPLPTPEFYVFYDTIRIAGRTYTISAYCVAAEQEYESAIRDTDMVK